MESSSVGLGTIDAEWFLVLAGWRIRSRSAVGVNINRVPPLIADTMVLVVTDVEPPCCFFPLGPLRVEEFMDVMYLTDRVLSGSTFCQVSCGLLSAIRAQTRGSPAGQRG